MHEPWKDWSPEAQAKAIAEGKTVLVNYTAQWCVTCKVNETVVFDRDVVKKALGSETVVAFLADWTNGDATITNSLAAVGRNSVPVYLVYRPGVPLRDGSIAYASVDGHGSWTKRTTNSRGTTPQTNFTLTEQRAITYY